MAVYTETKTYHTKAHMGMIDITGDFQDAVSRACKEKHISSGIITGFTTGGVAGLTTLEFEPGMVHHDQMCIRDRAGAPRSDRKTEIAVCNRFISGRV